MKGLIDRPIYDFEKRATIQIMIYLFEHKSARRTDLRDNINAVMETIYTSLKVLKRLGLIRERKLHKFPFTARAYLSKKGREVAERLDQIDKLLNKSVGKEGGEFG